jgi:hypothetical protein
MKADLIGIGAAVTRREDEETLADIAASIPIEACSSE